MFWEGEEFGEAYGLPDSGQCRVRGTRPICWENFYSQSDLAGSPTVLPLTTLYRCLGAIRTQYPAMRGPRQNAKKEIVDFNRKSVVYRRWLNGDVFVICVNFSGSQVSLDVPFGQVGRWVDVLEQEIKAAVKEATPVYEVSVTDAAAHVGVDVPSNFGRIFRFSPTP
jgi:maltooligosyltrehalose trehalohydrolase